MRQQYSVVVEGAKVPDVARGYLNDSTIAVVLLISDRTHSRGATIASGNRSGPSSVSRGWVAEESDNR
jgi:hypothetical protein